MSRCKVCGKDLTFDRYYNQLLCNQHGREAHNNYQKERKYWRDTTSWRERVRKYDKVHPEKYAARLEKAKDKSI